MDEKKESVLSDKLCGDINLLNDNSKSPFEYDDQFNFIAALKNGISIFFNNDILGEDFGESFTQNESIGEFCKMIESILYDCILVFKDILKSVDMLYFGNIMIRLLHDIFCEKLQKFGDNNSNFSPSELLKCIDLCQSYKNRVEKMNLLQIITIYDIDNIITSIYNTIIYKLEKHIKDYTQNCAFSITRNKIKQNKIDGQLMIDGIDDLFHIINQNFKCFYGKVPPNIILKLNILAAQYIKIYVDLLYQYFDHTKLNEYNIKCFKNISYSDEWFFWQCGLMNELIHFYDNMVKLEKVLPIPISTSSTKMTIRIYIETSFNDIILSTIQRLSHFIDYIIVDFAMKNNKKISDICETLEYLFQIINMTTSSRWNYIFLEIIYFNFCEAYICKIITSLQECWRSSSRDDIVNKIVENEKTLSEMYEKLFSQINISLKNKNNFIIKNKNWITIDTSYDYINIIVQLLKSNSMESFKDIIKNKLIINYKDFPENFFDILYKKSSLDSKFLNEMKILWKTSFNQQNDQKLLNKSFFGNIIKKNDFRNKQIDIERKKLFGNNTKTDLFNVDTKGFGIDKIFEMKIQ